MGWATWQPVCLTPDADLPAPVAGCRVGQIRRRGFVAVTMSTSSVRLEKTLTLVPSVALAITMVVGSGLLVLPGLAYKQAGGAALYAWLICSVVSVPVLAVIARLGAALPGSGGIAGFVQATYSRRLAIGTEILILGTMPGGAAVVITGGNYFASLFGGGQRFVVVGTALILVAGTVINYLGARISGRVQQLMAFTLVVGLAMVAILALTVGNHGQGTALAPLSRWPEAVPTIAMVFFSFVGWELMAFTSEEFENPRRDFPLMIALSFVVVVGLYTLVGLAVQVALPRDSAALGTAPMAALLTTLFGGGAGRILSVAAFFIVLANFTSGVWAFSRLVFSSAREGLLPVALARLDPVTHTPRAAVIAVTSTFALISVIHFLGIIPHSMLFEMGGGSFFLAYILAVLAYLRLVTGWPRKLFGLATLLFVGAVFLSFGLKALYPLFFFALGLVLAQRQSRSGGQTPQTTGEH